MTAPGLRLRSTGDSAVMKSVPEDFHVVEASGLEPEGAGEHLYLRLEKTALSTPEVARWLAAVFDVPETAVGYAGMKDARAVTEQWFSVHTSRDAAALPDRAGVRVISAARHRRKLRRGELTGNRFRIRLRDVTGERWPDALGIAREEGTANFFGPQRFGRDNLARARRWLAERRRRRGRSFQSGLHLSVLRSFLFNEVLAQRVDDGSWNRLIDGDVAAPLPASPDGSCGRQAPTGPLWGRGRSPAAGAALAVEQRALEPHGELCHGLEHAGLVQGRRSLVLFAPDLCWRVDGCTVELSFGLPPGGYATTLLGAAFELIVPEGRR